MEQFLLIDANNNLIVKATSCVSPSLLLLAFTHTHKHSCLHNNWRLLIIATHVYIANIIIYIYIYIVQKWASTPIPQPCHAIDVTPMERPRSPTTRLYHAYNF